MITSGQVMRTDQSDHRTIGNLQTFVRSDGEKCSRQRQSVEQVRASENSKRGQVHMALCIVRSTRHIAILLPLHIGSKKTKWNSKSSEYGAVLVGLSSISRAARDPHRALSRIAILADKTPYKARAHDMGERFEVSFEWHGNVLCVSISGRLDARASDSFAQKTDVAISKAGRVLEAVILDCSALEYISGLGWHHVLQLAHELHGRGIRLLVAELPAELYDVLGQADYLGLLKIYRTMSDAHRSLT